MATDSEPPDSIRRVFNLLADSLQELASEACNAGKYWGLRGVPEWLKNTTVPWEKSTSAWETPVTREIASRKRNEGFKDDSMCDYPNEAPSAFDRICPGLRGNKKMKGDLLIAVDSEQLLIECKAIWECIIPACKKTDSKPVLDDGKVYPRDYSGATLTWHPKETKTCLSVEEARIDAKKLSCCQSFHPKCHLGLWLLEFDRKGHQIEDRADYQDLVAYLKRDGWQIVDRPRRWDDSVDARRELGCQERTVLWWKRPARE
jgi:hypothetical protein